MPKELRLCIERDVALPDSQSLVHWSDEDGVTSGTRNNMLSTVAICGTKLMFPIFIRPGGARHNWTHTVEDGVNLAEHVTCKDCQALAVERILAAREP